MATNLEGPIRPCVVFPEAPRSKELNSQFSEIPILRRVPRLRRAWDTERTSADIGCVITYLPATLARNSRLKFL